ncbi:unnamed protein product, partial [Laminaria digitata]
QCYCGPSTDDPTQKGESHKCDFPCAGNPYQTCGGSHAINLYEYYTPVPAYAAVGCYADDRHNRVLTG